MSKLLAQGGFGCVYYPGIPCDSTFKNNKEFVSKLQKKNYASNNETIIGNKIKIIKNYKKHFRVHQTSCDIELSSIDKKLLENCRPIKMDTNIPYMMLNLEYLPNPDFFSLLFDNKKTAKHRYVYILQSYINIVEGFTFLSDLDIVQFDLKNENILYDKNNNSFLISDFGISLDMKEYSLSKLDKYFYIYAPDYYIWSFDIHLICLLMYNQEKITLETIRNMIDLHIDVNPCFELFSQNLKHIYFNKCFVFGKNYIDIDGQTRDANIKKLISGYKTWDNYGVSALYLRIIHLSYKNKIPKSNFLIEFTKLLLQNLSPDPKDRFSFKDTHSKMITLIKEVLTKDEIITRIETDSEELEKTILESKMQTKELKKIQKASGISILRN
jgi:serine/threonine protein kinase